MIESKFIVLGRFQEDEGAINQNIEWIVRGFNSLESAQKFIDRLSLDLIDAREYVNLEVENGDSGGVVEENSKLLDRFYRKYGHMVFGNEQNVALNSDKFNYRVERVEFESVEEDDESITKKYGRNKDEY